MIWNLYFIFKCCKNRFLATRNPLFFELEFVSFEYYYYSQPGPAEEFLKNGPLDIGGMLNYVCSTSWFYSRHNSTQPLP